MKMSVKIWIALALVLIGIGSVIFCGAFAASEFNILKLSREVSGYEQRTFRAAGEFTQVRIEDVDANIQIVRSEDGQCTVYYDETDRSTYRFGISDDVLTITHERHWLDSFGIIMSAPKLIVCLPEAAYAKFNVHTVSGSIQVEGLEFGAANLETTSGGIRLTNVRTASGMSSGTGSLRAKTTSGNIRLEGVNANSLALQCVSGGIRLESVDAESLALQTVSGSIRAELLSGKEYDVSSVSGRISVPDSESGAGLCQASTTSGSITISVAE